MYPQKRFAYHKRPFWPVLWLKRIGLPCCTFVTTIVTCSLQIILLSNYSAIYNFSTYRHYLTENYLSFPSAPHWVRHSYLLKRATIDPLYLWVITPLVPLRPNNSRGLPGTPSVDAINTRCISKPFRRPNTIILYINLYLWTILEHLVISWSHPGLQKTFGHQLS